MAREIYIDLDWDEGDLLMWEDDNCERCKKSVQNTGKWGKCALQVEIADMVMGRKPVRKTIIDRAGLEDSDICKELETEDGSLIPGTNAYYKQRKEDMAKLEAWVKGVG